MTKDYIVISGYSCLEKLSSDTKRIHLRKFVSKKLIQDILSISKNLTEVSLPRHISEKVNSDITDILQKNNITISVSENLPGRPNLLDNMMKWKGLTERTRLQV